MAGIVTGATLFALFVLLRGAMFGVAISATVPTAQAYIADVTHDEKTRTAGMARIGATQGLSMIGGSLIGGALAGFGLMSSLIAVPVLLAGFGIAVVGFATLAADLPVAVFIVAMALIGLGLGIAMPGHPGRRGDHARRVCLRPHPITAFVRDARAGEVASGHVAGADRAAYHQMCPE